MPLACRGARTRRMQCGARARSLPRRNTSHAARLRTTEVYDARGARRIWLVVAWSCWAAAPCLRAPLVDLERDDTRPIDIPRQRFVIVPAGTPAWEVSRDHRLEHCSGLCTIESRSAARQAHHAGVVHRVVERSARMRESVN